MRRWGASMLGISEETIYYQIRYMGNIALEVVGDLSLSLAFNYTDITTYLLFIRLHFNPHYALTCRRNFIWRIDPTNPLFASYTEELGLENNGRGEIHFLVDKYFRKF